jgi:diguanylate cyclase (GGDEF)-like protein
MKINKSILESGFNFDEEKDEYLAFRFRLFNLIMLVAATFALVFGVMHDLDINPISNFHAKVDYAYSLSTLVLLLMLRKSKSSFNFILPIFIAISFFTFVSALINVPADEFRAIWFYLLVFAVYALGGSAMGLVTTFFSIFAIILVNFLYPGHMSANATFSAVLGLMIFSLLSFVFTQKSTEYAEALIRKNSQLHKMAGKDPLTNVYNTRMYYSVGERIFKLARRNEQPMSALFIDIDHFKSINDKYGHDIGDKVLIRTAGTISSILRESDIIARIGGEEFAVLLADTHLKDAAHIADKIRRNIELMRCDDSPDELMITASIGVGALISQDKNLDDIKKRTDRAMYAAKHGGRNRIEIAD